MKLVPRSPVGVKRSAVMVEGRVREVSEPFYEVTAEGAALRAARVAAGAGLREAARRLSLTASELTALETGHATVSREEWQKLLSAVGPVCGEAR